MADSLRDVGSSESECRNQNAEVRYLGDHGELGGCIGCERWSVGGGLVRQVELGFGLVDANAAGFDHPESSDERSVSERSQQRFNQRFEHRKSRVSRQAQYDNPGTAVWWETGYVAEVNVQGDEAATFPAADLEQLAVRAAAELLAADRGYVVSCCEEELLCAGSEVLVEFELHRPEPAPMGTYRFLDISAP